MASQDVVVTYRAEVDDLTQKLKLVIDRMDRLETESKQAAKGLDVTTKSADKLDKELDQVGKSTKKASDNVKTFAKSAKTDLGGLGSQVTSIGLGIAAGLGAAFSVDAIISFGKASVSAFLEAQENAEKLRFTITQVGGESEAAFQRLIDQSEKLQKITIFSDDSIQQAQNALATFGLTATEIENLIPILADYASATKTDLLTATQQVGAGLQGTGREFKKYGIEVSATATAVENLSSITEGLVIFQGAATKETETLSGQLKQQANRADELQEALGSKLAPIYVRLKTVLFEATLGILGFNKALEDAAAQKTTAIENNILKSAEKIKQAGKDVVTEFSARVDELKVVNEKAGQDIEAINKRITDRITELSRSASDIVPEDDRIVKNLQKQVEATEKVISTTNDKIKAFTKVIEQEQQIASQNERTLTTDALRIKSIEELNRLLTENNKLNDLVSQANVDLINKELEARKKLASEFEKNKDVRIAGSAEEVKSIKAISAEYEALFKLLSDTDKAQLIELSVTAELDDENQLKDKIAQLKELAKNANIELPILTDPDGNLLALPDQVDALKTTLEANGIAIPLDIDTTKLEELRQKVAALKIELEKELTIPVTLEAPEPIEMNTGIEEAVDSDLKLWLDRNEQILTSSIDLFNSLTALYSAYAAKQLAQINETTQAEIEQLDTLGKYNQEQLDKRQISEREFANRQKKLEEEKIKAQEAADKKSREIKRKAAILDKAAAIFQIIIDTARAIAEVSPVVPLMALAAATGAAQTAIVVAQPIPYKKGTKRAKGGLSQVDEEGSEAILRVREGRLTMLDQGDKVLPAHKTVTYGKVLDTMFDGTFDKHYMKKEMAPRLVKQRQLHEKAEKKSFARNISESLVINSQLNTDPIARQLGKGVNISNLDELYNIIDQNRVSPYRR
jgi:peroxiredoxin